MGVEVRFFKKTEGNLLKNAIEKLWRPNHIYARNPEVMNHLVLNTPWKNELANEDEYSFVGMWIDDEIVGLQGVMPQEANILGKIVKAQTSTIWVAKKIKGKSVDGMLMDEYACTKRHPSFGFALGLSKRAARVHKIRGGYVNDNMPRWIAINDISSFKKVFDVECNIDFCHLLVGLKSSVYRYNVEVNRLDKEKWNEFYFGVMAPSTIGVCRDYKFLKWRYLESPVLKCHIIALRDKENNYLGLSVIRIEKILDDMYSIGRILEFISFDVEASACLASEIMNFDKEVIFWDFYCLSDVTAFGLETVGFKKIPPWDNKMTIPTRFQPIDNSVVKLNCSIILDEELKEFVEPIDSSHWYITRGDADQDRAN